MFPQPFTTFFFSFGDFWAQKLVIAQETYLWVHDNRTFCPICNKTSNTYPWGHSPSIGKRRVACVVAPPGIDRRAEAPVLDLWQRGEPVLQETFKARLGGLQDLHVLNSSVNHRISYERSTVFAILYSISQLMVIMGKLCRLYDE